MTTYRVTLINSGSGFEQTIDIPDTEAILFEAAEQQIKIPFECVVGSCGICEGQLISGSVDQSDQIFLSADQVATGRVLTCVAKPTSDCVVAVELDTYI